MKLELKGRFQPPPPLPTAAQAVSDTVASWAEVHARTHWLLGDERVVDGADFYVGERELGHIHLDGEAHLMLPRGLADDLIEAKLARRFRWSRDAVVFPIAASSVAHATSLFRFNYERLRGAETGELRARLDALREASPGALSPPARAAGSLRAAR